MTVFRTYFVSAMRAIAMKALAMSIRRDFRAVNAGAFASARPALMLGGLLLLIAP
jgi:hypothetical protein